MEGEPISFCFSVPSRVVGFRSDKMQCSLSKGQW
jgi:hypothetical protein